MEEKFIKEVANEETKEEVSIDMRELAIKFDRLTDAVRVNAQVTGETVTALCTMAESMQKMEKIVSGIVDAASIQQFRDGDNLAAILLREALKK